MGERGYALTNLFTQASTIYNDTKIITMNYTISDRGNENPHLKVYSMCFNKEIPTLEKYCGPDWTFFNWPSASITSFENTRDEIIEKSLNNPKINKVGWVGNLHSPLSDVIEYRTRPLLREIYEKNTESLEVIHVAPVDTIISNKIQDYISIPDLVEKYKYLIDIGGNGYSGRLKYLLFSRRPLLIVDRQYIEYFHQYLEPYIHYIPVKNDLSDLLTQIEWMKENEEKCLQIANNAFNFAVNNFTRQKICERINYVFKNML